MRLIDADNYCKNICRCNSTACDKAKCQVLNAPIAYDVDKVVERLKVVCVEEPIIDKGVEVGTFKVLLLKDAVEIVKGGGGDE